MNVEITRVVSKVPNGDKKMADKDGDACSSATPVASGSQKSASSKKKQLAITAEN